MILSQWGGETGGMGQRLWEEAEKQGGEDGAESPKLQKDSELQGD